MVVQRLQFLCLMARALAYIHGIRVCHTDIKPRNLLVKGEPNISYICSTYYRAPELIFEIDIWSVGCVLAELLLRRLDVKVGEKAILKGLLTYFCCRQDSTLQWSRAYILNVAARVELWKSILITMLERQL